MQAADADDDHGCDQPQGEVRPVAGANYTMRYTMRYTKTYTKTNPKGKYDPSQVRILYYEIYEEIYKDLY